MGLAVITTYSNNDATIDKAVDAIVKNKTA